MESDRLINSEAKSEDFKTEISLRPKTFSEYVGQEKVKQTLTIAIEAAKKRQESLDHVLLYGPPGLGKTTLANVIAYEMGTDIKITSGPAIEKAGDLVSILTRLQKNDVLFIFPHQIKFFDKKTFDMSIAIDCLHEMEKKTIKN